MKFKILATSAILASICVQPVLAQDQGANMAPPNAAVQTQQSDASMIGWLIVLNKNEINISKEVLGDKNLKPEVRNYAKYLLTQHTQLLNETLSLSKKLKIKPVEDQSAIELKKDGSDGLASLKSLDGMPMQKAFIDAMVQGHTEALAALNDDLKNKEYSKLDKLLNTTANHVSMHLKKAKEIQENLKKA